MSEKSTCYKETLLDEEGIRQLLLQEPVDLVLLRRLCRQKGGLLDNRVRGKAWPKLLQINRSP
jgi:hypothetical protein